VNKLSRLLYLTDFDGHLVNVEGSPVFNRKRGEMIGIRLPSVHSFNLFMGCSLVVPIDAIMEALSNKLRKFTREDKHEQDSVNSAMIERVVRIRDGHLK
jgi:hypothetical protein